MSLRGLLVHPIFLRVREVQLKKLISSIYDLYRSDIVVETDTSQTFVRSQHGLRQLVHALEDQSIGSLHIEGHIRTTVRFQPPILRERLLPDYPVTVSITGAFIEQTLRNEFVEEVAYSMKSLFTDLEAAAGFISTSADSAIRTQYEIKENVLTPVRWSEMNRYFRGVFWGNALGNSLCTYLGGNERVLEQAPVSIKESLANGAWLQSSDTLYPSKQSISQLEAFLKPILRFGAAERDKE